MNTGGIYDPATDSWSPTSTGANVPNPRRFHQAVWTGTQMIIWGGEGGGYLSTGGMYSPVTNSWTATSVGANMPSPRIHHTAVWTGNRMIIWGGRDNLSVPTGSGGIFDPTNNTWLPTAMVMGPTPRQYHTAIWTGSHMVVWGGDNGSTDTHTGMRLEPTTLTWSSISVGPSPRTRHTAVWTGSKMIIWGGYASLVSTFISTGGIWDSATDTWLPTSLIGAPPATQLALGFWTGSKMLIWSGDPATTNIGGLYDPVSHTWSATSLGANVPSPRWGATGVWTGSEMLIWGGMTSTGETNSGSRYTP